MHKITEKIREKYGTVAFWAKQHGFPANEVYRVIGGFSGKMESPKTLSGKIALELKKVFRRQCHEKNTDNF